jgi:hypothetical protein
MSAATQTAPPAPIIPRCPRVHPRRPRGAGFSVDENAIRWTNYHHVLTTLFQTCAGFVAKTPHIDAKILLGTDLWDFAQWIEQGHARIPDPETGRLPRHGRLRELRVGGSQPHAPHPKIAEALDALLDERVSWKDYLVGAYLVLLPKLADAWKRHLRETHAIADEPSIRILKPALARLRRQMDEMRAAVDRFVAGERESAWLRDFRHKVGDWGEDFARLEPVKGETRKIASPSQRFIVPERDPGFRVLSGGDPAFDWMKVVRQGEVPTDRETLLHYIHQLCDAEVTAAELVALMIHLNPWMPWACAYDLARQVWDEIRHFELVEDNLTQVFGGYWGEFPIAMDFCKKVIRHDLIAMLWILNREMEGNAMPKHRKRRDALAERWPSLAMTFDHLFGDEGPHVGNSVWAPVLFEMMQKMKEEGKEPIIDVSGFASTEEYVRAKSEAMASASA